MRIFSKACPLVCVQLSLLAEWCYFVAIPPSLLVFSVYPNVAEAAKKQKAAAKEKAALVKKKVAFNALLHFSACL